MKTNGIRITAASLIAVLIVFTIIFSPFTTAVGQSSTYHAQAIVLVNSSSERYFDFTHFIQPYLDHFGVPYTVLDISASPLPSDLDRYALIIIGHNRLDVQHTFLNASAQQIITSAVNSGSGLINFDSDLADPNLNYRYQFIQDIFSFGYTAGAAANNVAINSASPLGGYIVAAQATNATYTLNSSITPLGVTLAPGSSSLATLGGKPFLVARTYGQGRALQWTSYDWMNNSVWGPMHGFDDLIWKGMVWAARKPFVMQGLPPFYVMRVDDVTGPLWWIDTANQFGFKPWLGLFLHEIDDSEATQLSNLVNANKATASIHSFTDTQFFYRFFTDSQMAANFAEGTQFHQSHNIPISKFVIPHYYEIGANSFTGLSNWGVEFIGTQMIPGDYWGSAWLMLGPYRKYDSGISNAAMPTNYADFLPIPNHPEYNGKFFECLTEPRDIASEWMPASNLNVSIGRATSLGKRAFDSMILATFFTHEYRITPLTPQRWQDTLQGVVNNLAPYNPIFVTMDYACQYVRAMYTSNIAASEYDPATGSLMTTMSGKTDMPTMFYLFTEQNGVISSSFVDVPQFSNPTQVSNSLIPPTATATNTPGPSPTSTATPTATSTYTATPTPTATQTPTNTATPSPTNTPTDTLTPSATPLPSDTPTPTATYTDTPIPTDTLTPTPSDTPTVTPTPTVTFTPTNTPTPTDTPTATATFTATPTPTDTPTPTATPVASVIFADGFESGSLSAWSGNSGGNLLVSPASAMSGGYGLEITISSSFPTYVRTNNAASEYHYHASFLFDPNSIAMDTGDSLLLVRGMDGNSPLFQIGFGFNGSQYELNIVTFDDSGNMRISNWAALNDAPNLVQFNWDSATGAGANNGTASLVVNGNPPITFSSLDTDTRKVDQVRIGATGGIDLGTRGTFYFDDYSATR